MPSRSRRGLVSVPGLLRLDSAPSAFPEETSAQLFADHPTWRARPTSRGKVTGNVFSGSAQRASDLVAAIEAGTVGLNTGVIVHRDSPLGGIKDSGWGSDGGLEGLAEFQVVKAVSRRS